MHRRCLKYWAVRGEQPPRPNHLYSCSRSTPHDGAHGDFKTGQTAQQILEDMKREVEVLERFGLEAGLRLARGIFPQAYIDEKKCAQLLDCLSRYKRQIDPRTQEPGAPLHDDASHGADVWRYIGMALPRMDNDAGNPGQKIKRHGSSMAR